MNAVVKDLPHTDFKVRDLSLAEFGRKRIRMAEEEMPGLMSIRAKYAPLQPLSGVRLSGSLHMTKETAVLIETLSALGASVRWASPATFSPPRMTLLRHRCHRHSGVRLEGRNAGGILGLHAGHADLPRWQRSRADRR
jgi:hypothetical protein